MTREVAVQFGDGNNLEGVLTYPAEPAVDLPALILLNAGLLHKVGPNRLHPVLARRMSDRGIHTLRLDLQGLGDSLPGRGVGTLAEQTRDSVVAAMDLVTRETGKQTFILGGLCSGAEDSFRVGVQDDRVVGLVLLDAHAYPTKRHKFHHLWFRLRRKSLKILGYYLPGEQKNATGLYANDETAQRFGLVEFPDRGWVSNSLQTMIGRGVKMLYVYSGAWAEYFNYRKQFYDMFPDVDFRGAATVHYFGNQDHTIVLRSDQERVIGAIEQWLDALAGTFRARRLGGRLFKDET